ADAVRVHQPPAGPGGRRRGIAPVPPRSDLELLERPVHGAAEVWLLGEHAEVVTDEVPLELVRALLGGRPVAVRLGADLAHGERLPRVAGVHLVEVRREPRWIGDARI